MQWLAEICVKRPVFATMLIMAMVVVGSFSFFSLGVDRFPKVDLPIVAVVTRNAGAAPQEIETEITTRIEGAVNSVAGIDTLTSSSVEGISTVVVQFDLSKDVDVGAQEIRDKIETVLFDLPETADRPVVQKVDPDASPIVFYAVSAPMETKDLTEIVRKQLKEKLETINGVGAVNIYGGREREIHININPERLRAYDLSVAQVANALRTQNSELPGGKIEQGANELTVRTMGRITEPQDFGRIVIANVGGYPIKISDIGTVEDSGVEPASAASVDGQSAVILAITKQSGTNTVAIIDAVKEKMAELEPTLPPNFTVKLVRDQSEFIQASLNAIEEHLLLGGLFASIIVFIFLWNFRATIISALAIPISIIATFGVMAVMGYTLNQMTMLSLTLMVGIVIDDAIVVLENIFRFIEEKGMPPFQAAIEGTKEIGLAVMATTLSLLAVFVPVGFMGGIVGRFMGSFGLTSGAAIAVSLIVSFTLTPMLAARWIKKEDFEHADETAGNAAVEQNDAEGPQASEPAEKAPVHHETKATGWYAPIDRTYTWLLKKSMAHRWVIVTICVAAVLSIVPLFMLAGFNFLPEDDESQFQIQVRAPEGTSLAATQSVLERIGRDIKALPGVDTTMAIAGFGAKQVVNNGSIFVRLTPVSEREDSQTQLMAKAREIVKKYPDNLVITVQAVPSIGGGGSNAAIQYIIGGPDLDKLDEYSAAVLEKMKQDPNMVDVDRSLIPGKPEVRVVVDRERAADLGVSVAAVTQTLNTLLAGQQVTTYNAGTDQFDVVLRADSVFRRDQKTLEQFTVPTDSGGTVTLASLVKLEESSGPAGIDRLSRQRQVTLMANVPPGGSQSEAIASIEKYVEELNMDAGYQAMATGQSKELGRAGFYFMLAFALSFIFMYMILAAQFESFIHPVTILLTLPLAIPFALISTFIAGQALNIFSMLGILLLFGIVKKNAILQIDHTIHLRSLGMSRYDAIIQANRDRLRPILMTTIALVAGMIPLVLSTGPGAGTNRSIGVLVVGGQSLCLLLTLLAVPVFYSIFEDIGEAPFIKKAAAGLSSVTGSVRSKISGAWTGVKESFSHRVKNADFAEGEND
jgi:HAE1 family hydrophobic/amphiphilic exporter-1